MYGIDVSTWQKSIDWKQAATRAEFAIIRTGFAKTLDNMFLSHMAGAEAAGIPVGLYHFSYAYNVSEAESEAAFAVNLADKYPNVRFIAFDFEYDSVKHIKDKHGITATKTLVTRLAWAFFAKIMAAGYIPVLYTNPDYLARYFDRAALGAAVRIWLAAWGKSDPPTADNSDKCDIWQYAVLGSADSVKAGVATAVGAWPGIAGKVDVNVCYDRSLFVDEPEANDGTQASPAKRYITLDEL